MAVDRLTGRYQGVRDEWPRVWGAASRSAQRWGSRKRRRPMGRVRSRSRSRGNDGLADGTGDAQNERRLGCRRYKAMIDEPNSGPAIECRMRVIVTPMACVLDRRTGRTVVFVARRRSVIVVRVYRMVIVVTGSQLFVGMRVREPMGKRRPGQR